MLPFQVPSFRPASAVGFSWCSLGIPFSWSFIPSTRILPTARTLAHTSALAHPVASGLPATKQYLFFYLFPLRGLETFFFLVFASPLRLLSIPLELLAQTRRKHSGEQVPHSKLKIFLSPCGARCCSRPASACGCAPLRPPDGSRIR